MPLVLNYTTLGGPGRVRRLQGSTQIRGRSVLLVTTPEECREDLKTEEEHTNHVNDWEG